MKKTWRRLSLFVGLLGITSLLSGATASVTVSAERLIQFLNQSITLYHETTIQQRSADDPQEQLLLYDNSQLASQAVGLAFTFARAQLDVMSAQPLGTGAAASGQESSQYDSLRQMVIRINNDIEKIQGESDADRQKLATATASKHAQLESEISELQGELALAQARLDATRSMLDFVGGSATKNLTATGLRAEVDALASSVPGVTSGAQGPSHAPAESFTATNLEPPPSGIWGYASDSFGLLSKLRTINSMIADANALLETSNDVRQPFVDQLRTLSQQGDRLAAQAGTADRAKLAQERQQLDAITAEFKDLTSAVIPIAKQRVLLNLYLKNLNTWRNNVYSRYKSDLRNLGIRLGALGLVLGVLYGLSEIWRRAVYRYVQEPRRRHQFLLLRKVTFWVVIGFVLLLTFASKLGSFFTFAGLLTAGVAVALQNVILAAVGYFFLIGKFGIRVGDYIEVNGTKGEVIDIGLVRFHVMELGAAATPTGRVAAFSNSVVFQPTSGLFKQIPGATFAWHEVTLTVPRDADFDSIKKSLLGAVENVLRDYREGIETSYHELEKTGILVSDRGLLPKLELHLTTSGIEATIRYPVDLQHATDIDARVTRELLTALANDSQLQTPQGSGIHLKTNVPAGAPSP